MAKSIIHLAALAVCSVIAACGGGGDGGSGGDGGGADSQPGTTIAPDYVQWSGSVNGATLKDDSNENFKVRADTRQLYAADWDIVLNGTQLDESGVLSIFGQRVGTVQLRDSTVGTKIAVLFCDNGKALDLLQDAATRSYRVDCGTATTPPPPPPTASISFFSWNGSANGTVVKDKNNESFKVRTDTRQVYSVSWDSPLLEAYVDANAKLTMAGQRIGSVQLRDSTDGSKVAAFVCENGNLLDIVADNATRSYRPDCGTTGSPPAPPPATLPAVASCFNVTQVANPLSLRLANSCPETVYWVACVRASNGFPQTYPGFTAPRGVSTIDRAPLGIGGWSANFQYRSYPGTPTC